MEQLGSFYVYFTNYFYLIRIYKLNAAQPESAVLHSYIYNLFITISVF